ncbi:MAG: non-canonical purine NTP pyrophosphatase, RdgB/HAM1 family [Candidatus Cloacimonas sp. 4484_275]|nr:MAG: non-canonical purine NTP pyrophosphatase, RdgB/HAM1 family [Candidatus Cloacimonas sp. 4484_275]RLC51327.1 MAG: non-canonical purine NTP pyrophosphatase, RdgB/HAM1 family [Candidatus Cloacimonadota bacterium]
MTKILVASRNEDKISEIKEILKDLSLEIVSAKEFPELPEVVEDKDTIEGNAIKKALECAKFTGLLAIADDTGLFVEALNGKPGVYAARFAGENCSYQDNREKLLAEMKDKENRKAEFRTAVAFASPKGLIKLVVGKVEGEIARKEMGENGFGYDPIFRALETGKTFGEMSEREKHQISHRARALRKLIPFLRDYLAQASDSQLIKNKI